RIHQLCLCGWAVITIVPPLPSPSDSGDEAIRADPTDAGITVIHDIQAGVRSDRDASGRSELGRRRRAAVAAVSPSPVAGHSGDYAVRSDPTDTIVVEVCDIQAAV